MNVQLQEAQSKLWRPGGIGQQDVDLLLGRLMAKDVDLGELFFQYLRQESWALEDGIVKEGGFSVDQGVGVRAVAGEKTGFAYAEDLQLDALRAATEAARSISRASQQGRIRIPSMSDVVARYAPADPIHSLDDADKVALLERMDRTARGIDNRVREVNVRVSASQESLLVVATDGTLAADVRPLVRLDVSVIVEQNGRRERGSAGAGGRYDLHTLCGDDLPDDLAREAVRSAILNLDAGDAPAGPMTVVLGPGWPGVLLHEAVGHGLEGDFNRKGSSAFANRIGEQVASPLCTVVDDGTLDRRRGSLTIDDEGTPTRPTVLIENGVLRGYMQDKLNSRLMGVRPTGNGRRQSYAHLPMPRMTNTFMQAGSSDPAEIIASVEKGIFAVNFGGGQVDITSGRFVFSATEAYLIEKGKVTRPIRGATLIGNG
ncbi:MAG: metalloprotease TldD, partial [Pseudomonadales bacterium]|nr:metalloprotease TldD [Pseudomonadales bacterium]